MRKKSVIKRVKYESGIAGITKPKPFELNLIDYLSKDKFKDKIAIANSIGDTLIYGESQNKSSQLTNYQKNKADIIINNIVTVERLPIEKIPPVNKNAYLKTLNRITEVSQTLSSKEQGKIIQTLQDNIRKNLDIGFYKNDVVVTFESENPIISNYKRRLAQNKRRFGLNAKKLKGMRDKFKTI